MKNLHQQIINDLDRAEIFSKAESDILYFMDKVLGFKPNPFQQRVGDYISSWFNSGDISALKMLKMIWDTGNRVGKTVMLSVIHLWFLYYKKGITKNDFKYWSSFKYSTFNISPISRQAKNLMDYIEAILTNNFGYELDGEHHVNKCLIGGFIKKNESGKLAINHTTGEINFVGERKLICMSTAQDQGAGFQGLACGLMTYDECVQSYHLEAELPGRIGSRLGDYGIALILVATPDDQAPSQQYYYHIVKDSERAEKLKGIPEYKVIHGYYEENIFISEQQRQRFVEEQMKNPLIAAQVLKGAFVSTGAHMFEQPVIHRIWNGKKLPTAPLEGHEYLIPVDWGVSDTGDETIMYVIDFTNLNIYGKPAEIVKEVAVLGGDPWNLMATLKLLSSEYNTATVIMDTASMGGVMFKKMLKELKPISFEGLKQKQEALTRQKLLLTHKRKYRIMETGEIEEKNSNFGLIRSYYIAKLEDELASYKVHDDKLKQDRVMALAMGCWWLWKKFMVKKAQSVYNINPFKQNINLPR